MPTRRLPALLLAACIGAVALPGAADEVTVYRCVDGRGQVTLGDVPCSKGSQEQVRAMQRPKDGTPLAVAAPVPDAPAQAAPPQVVVMRAPQPMYECVTPDGERYTSETGDGNPRWVPLWTLGYRSGWRGGGRPGSNIASDRLNDWNDNRPLGGRVGAPTPRAPEPAYSPGPDRPRPPHRPPAYGAGGGTWVRDTCHALPQEEVCARLADRREQIRRRFFNAQESERNLLRREERGLNARLAADCGLR
ncbi:MAG: DUF4124 domain-containing protein [Luteimonas sp.]|nr:DUF4124 domain-containing protein [Luteimonas sp.]